MNIIKEHMYMNKVKTKNTYQLTLDNDYIISDKKPDVSKIIRQQGEVLIDEQKVQEDKVEVKGRVRVSVLYLSDDEESSINSIVEYMPYVEIINIPGVTSNDTVYIKGDIEDLTVSIINSRKFSVKTILNLNTTVDEEIRMDVAVGIEDLDRCQIRKRPLDVTRLMISKKDIYRIKDEIVLQSSKKNISEILYYDINIVRSNTRMADEKIIVKGDLVVFILYITEDGEYECLEKEITYNGDIELYEARENMIDDILVTIVTKDVIAKNDEDGECRLIDIDVALNLDIKCYMDESIDILEDAYSLDCEMELIHSEVGYETLLLKNNTSFRVEDTLKLDEKSQDILQVCNSSAIVKIDDEMIHIDSKDTGIKLEGVVETNVIYISSKDNSPINSITHITPFVHIIEVENICEDSVYSIKPCVEDVSVMMLAGSELEIKVVVGVDTMIFNCHKDNVIVDMESRLFDQGIYEERASIVGYTVKEGDDLWSIGKKFYTTVDMLKDMNSFVDKDVCQGDKLLIIK